MAKYKIVAGDFEGGSLEKSLGAVTVMYRVPGKLMPESLWLNKGNVSSVEAVTEQNKKKFAGAAGWGLAGAVAFGPLGALAGILAGGKKTEICAAVYLKDGRKFMTIVDQKMYKELVALNF